MSAEHEERNGIAAPTTPTRQPSTGEAIPRTPENADAVVDDDTTVGSADDGDEDDENEEPKLKYTRVTESLGSVYRNGDSTSAFVATGDKLVMGTHNGVIHVLSLPSFQPLRNYKAHKATVTAVSVSPYSPSMPTIGSLIDSQTSAEPETKPTPGLSRTATSASGASSSPQKPRQSLVPQTANNQIYIATSSIDGHVCVQSLVDPRDVTLRNFARPVQAVALSPEYKSDKTYLSGGLAGNLILTVGGKAGVSANANTNSTAAAASGWLGSIGLGQNTGSDTIKHSGEGAISTIKWSLSGKFVVWANEKGLWLMRTNLRLESEYNDFAWKRFGHVPTPQHWSEEMPTLYKARCEWVDDRYLETDDTESDLRSPATNAKESDDITSLASSVGKAKPTARKWKRVPEKLIVGWGDKAWIFHVTGDRVKGRAELIQQFEFEDCIVSGLSLYTPSLLLVLAYRTRDDDDNLIATTAQTTPRRGVQHRQNGLSPELKLIDTTSREEVEVDSLPMSRYESLSAADYHLGALYIPKPKPLTPAQRGALEAIGGGLLDAGHAATRLLSSGASVLNFPIGNDKPASVSSADAIQPTSLTRRKPDPHPSATTVGLKILIQSPYDCILAVRRELSDRLDWDLKHENYKEAWELLSKHPEAIGTIPEQDRDRQYDSTPSSTPSRARGSLADFFADDGASQTTVSANKAQFSAVEKEKRRIGDLWVEQLVNAERWAEAGKIAGSVLGTASRWEHWILKFAQANRFDEITPYIPSTLLSPPIPSYAYEVILGSYVVRDVVMLRDLLEKWDYGLFDIQSVITTIRNRLQAGDFSESSSEGSEPGRDWRLLQELLAKLYVANGQPREALHYYIRLQDADAVMDLIQAHHGLLEALRDDIPGFILLRVSNDQLKSASRDELEEASSEAMRLLVDEAYQGVIHTADVVKQLQRAGFRYQLFLFFYLRALWKGQGTQSFGGGRQQIAEEGKSLVEDFGDLCVELFAEYDRDLFMEFLKSSQSYAFEKASAICERRKYIPELIYLLSKTGQTKRALHLIISDLSDVSLAIAFAKEQNDPDLWDDLLDYSMGKPRFIRALLEEVGTAIDPITLVKRIPEGLEIKGLREGIGRMVREYEIQHSISEGVAKVLRGEVATGMEILRAGQKRAVKFEVLHEKSTEIDVSVDPAMTAISSDETLGFDVPKKPLVKAGRQKHRPGHCIGCAEAFSEYEKDTLIGFACGHVYHLQCLLDRLPEDSISASAAQALQTRLIAAHDTGSSYSSRSVGAKVAHAHIIRSVIQEGCLVCNMTDKP